MGKPHGVAMRIRARLKALGYWKAGRPDVLRFCRENGCRRQDLYAWLGGRVPGWKNMIRLATDLRV